MNQLLSIRGLRTYFYTESGVAKAVDGVDLDIAEGEVLGLVGESGSGKSVTALSVLRLIPDPPGRIVAGEIIYRGRDLLKLSQDEIREIRGNDISMVFQEPMTSLNPVFTIGMQVMEVIQAHQHVSKDEAHRRAVEILTDLVRHPLLRAEDLDLERNVVLEEISGVDDTPDDLVFELHAKTLWPEHPYGYSILGTPGSVGALTAGDLALPRRVLHVELFDHTIFNQH